MFKTIFLASVLLFGVGCKGNKANSAATSGIDQKAITTTWYLVSADNSLKVFSSKKEEIAPRRGYESMSFQPDGTCTRTIPGPTDRPEVKSGTWRWKSATELSVIIDEAREILKIHRLSTDRLEIITQQ